MSNLHGRKPNFNAQVGHLRSYAPASCAAAHVCLFLPKSRILPSAEQADGVDEPQASSQRAMSAALYF